MTDELLKTAREQAQHANPSLRAAALLRIARADSAANVSRATNTIREALQLILAVPYPLRRHLLDEARSVAAAVFPELLTEVPAAPDHGHRQFASDNIVQIMVSHGHVDAACNYLLNFSEETSFPSLSVAGVLYALPETDARRRKLLRRAADVWRRTRSTRHHHERDHFLRLFGTLWKELPQDEALALARMIAAEVVDEPDTETASGYGNEVHFTSRRQDALFAILHVLRHIDSTLAESLIASHDQLAAAARRYPDGLETMHKELEAEAERRKASGVVREPGYIIGGNPADFDRQLRLVKASRSGDFDSSFDDAMEKYREDSSAATPNYAPKEYWPSTAAFRTLLHAAGKRLGPDAARLLQRIPDNELRLFATIELAAALAGLPPSSITQMKQPLSPEERQSLLAAAHRNDGDQRRTQ